MDRKCGFLSFIADNCDFSVAEDRIEGLEDHCLSNQVTTIVWVRLAIGSTVNLGIPFMIFGIETKEIVFLWCRQCLTRSFGFCWLNDVLVEHHGDFRYSDRPGADRRLKWSAVYMENIFSRKLPSMLTCRYLPEVTTPHVWELWNHFNEFFLVSFAPIGNHHLFTPALQK